MDSGRFHGDFIGRDREIATLNRLAESARAGESGVLVVRGEPGVGKSALVHEWLGSTSGFRVARTVGVESEIELPFAALHQLCAPLFTYLERVPGPQRGALSTVFGLSEGPAPDRFLVGLAVLSLLSEAARFEPLVCVVDDAQWLDRASAQALTFAARRLMAESVVVILVTRDSDQSFARLPELVVTGLGLIDARALLASVISSPLDDRVRDRIVAETRGNPLGLLELPRGRSAAELAGGFGGPCGEALSSQLEASFLSRARGLSLEAWLTLLIAAADPTGDPALLWGAGAWLGLGPEAAGSAESQGLLKIDGQVVCAHPLVRSAVYGAASLEERRKVHAALAEVTNPVSDPDRRAWHRAQGAVAPDEEVAAELEQSAGRAHNRGGFAASAAILEQAVRLTLDPERRARRALAAAQAKYLAGDPEAALRLVSAAEGGQPTELERAELDVIRADSAFSQNRGRDAPGLLLRAATRLEPLNVGLARDTYLDALVAAHYAGRLSFDDCGVMEVARSALAAPPGEKPRASDLLLDGWVRALVHEYPAGVEGMRQAVLAFRDRRVSDEEDLRWLFNVGHIAAVLWDVDSSEILTSRHVELARESGALSVLPLALTARTFAHLYVGEFSEADRLVQEMRVVSAATGIDTPGYGPFMLAAWRGAPDASTMIDDTLADARRRGEGAAIANGEYARALLLNSRGHYAEAFEAAAASEHPELDGLAISPRGVPELVEAAVRSGRAEQAREAIGRLAVVASATGTDWALGMLARSRGLLSNGDTAERHYRDAIERLGRTRIRPELARAHLLYGEWLRRQGRRVDARAQLHTAHDMFRMIGMETFAERARVELLATGEQVRPRRVDTALELTPQEQHIAQLATGGLSNPEIGARLFISARTVEWHLRKVFTKLGVTSRKDLRRALPHLAQAPLRM